MTITLNGTTGITLPNGSASAPAATGSDTDTGIVYGTNTVQVATGGTTAVTVDSSQNVGIGTSSPNAKLTSTATNGNTAISIIDTTNTTLGTETNYLSFYGTTAGGSLITTPLTQIGAISENGTYQQGSLVFKTTPYNSSSTERMRIDSSGNLLVGKTTNNNNTVGFAVNSTGVVVSTVSSDICALFDRKTTTGQIVLFRYNDGDIGSISTNGSATAYNTTSDYRLKENVAPMTGALATVSALKPVTYTWKADGSDGQGFIAHELQAVVPDCVTGEKDAVDAEGNPVYQGIDTSFLVATLTAAIQELKAELDTVKTELATLKGTA